MISCCFSPLVGDQTAACAVAPVGLRVGGEHPQGRRTPTGAETWGKKNTCASWGKINWGITKPQSKLTKTYPVSV